MQSLKEHLQEDKHAFINSDKTLHFPEGLPAFETVKDWVLIFNEEEAPFLWLQAVSVPNLAFVTIDPFLVSPGYRPDVCDEDVAILELENPKDAFVLSIVNIHNSDGQGVTANLVGPIIINCTKLIGKQCILKNHLQYSVRFRIDS